MKTEIDQGKRLAAVIAGRRTPSSPLVEQVRREAIAYTRHRLTQGASQATVARELAVTAMTVSRWLSTTCTLNEVRDFVTNPTVRESLRPWQPLGPSDRLGLP